MGLELLLLGDTPVAQLAEQARFAESVRLRYRLARRRALLPRGLFLPRQHRPRHRPYAAWSLCYRSIRAASGADRDGDRHAGRNLRWPSLAGPGRGRIGLRRTGHPAEEAAARDPRIHRAHRRLAAWRAGGHAGRGDLVPGWSSQLQAGPPQHSGRGRQQRPVGQRTAGAVADGAIMEACGSVAEVRAFRAEVERGAASAGRDPRLGAAVSAAECLYRGRRKAGARHRPADRGATAGTRLAQTRHGRGPRD